MLGSLYIILLEQNESLQVISIPDVMISLLVDKVPTVNNILEEGCIKKLLLLCRVQA